MGSGHASRRARLVGSRSCPRVHSESNFKFAKGVGLTRGYVRGSSGASLRMVKDAASIRDSSGCERIE